jgi:transglutaminase-like putative cysteine protease
MPWEEARSRVALPDDRESLDASEFLFDSFYVTRAPEFEGYAEPSFAAGRPLFEAVQDLSTRIYKDFAYKPKATSIDMPLRDVFRLRRGVCQDFAHIMIASLRSWQLPARYVSGYLRSGAKFMGAEASHAWVSAYIPDFGWVDFDPTNNVLPQEGHVILGWGRDYGDVTPVKGISLGGGGQTVDVAVRVVPIQSPDDQSESKP